MSGFPTPIPQTPITDGAGNLATEWWRFFVQIQKAIGGPNSPFDDAALLASGQSPLASQPVVMDMPFPAPVVPREEPSPFNGPVAPQEDAAPYNGPSPVASALVAQMDEIPTTYAPIASPAFTGPWSAAGLLEINSTIHITSGTSPATGVGMELAWGGTFSRVLSYSRTGGTYQPLQFSASSIALNISGTDLVTLTAAAAAFALPVRLNGYTVATLPAGTQGDTAFVTDALAPVYLAAVVGGGAVVTPVFRNATIWVAQ